MIYNLPKAAANDKFGHIADKNRTMHMKNNSFNNTNNSFKKLKDFYQE